ncbi:hypothetical protein [Azospirillum sp. SYSU D00513]|uniref:vWA domain-containing protein n=1 Tax=Azospirillum sp. SYSU D00513 TaxID=2812561 RepID=UPI001A95AFB8|nr:hypothetical protein [Azospirillum sp. SYSU D00513]
MTDVRAPSRAAAAAGLFGLLAVLAVVIGWLALSACGLFLPGVGWLLDSCAVAAPSISQEEAERLRGATLAEEARQLERRLAQAASCPTPPPGAPLHAAAPQPPPQLAACPVRRSDRVALLLDASTSMKLSYTLDPDLERRTMEAAQKVEASGMGRASPAFAELQSLLQEMEAAPGTPRIELAKQALTQLADAADAETGFELISFAQCGPPRHQGRFSPAQRAELKRAISGTELRDSTALADAIAALPRMIPREEGAGRPLNVVLISDGNDSCGGDPCAAAAQLEQERPEINVNVLAITRSIGAIRCVADRTGGQFLQAGDAASLAPLLRTAAGQNVPDHCR